MFSKVRSEKLEVRSKKREVKIFFSIFYFLFFILFSLSANAQCAMCRAALGGDANKAQAQAVNDGIVYLMVIPYLLVGVIGYYIYRMRMKKKQQ
ncbi:MAG: hypothetical protein PHC28_10500 [Flavobacterium sp.]|nr:hypothetical protein [Flavobacterium sp.]MDD5150887.1 hypothetical protein [Flavobacterium sp.]